MHTYTLLFTDLVLLDITIKATSASALETEAAENLAAREEEDSVLINVSKVESD